MRTNLKLVLQGALGLVLVATSGCGPGSAAPQSLESRIEQRPASAPPSPTGPHLGGTELLLAIESDVNGKSVEPVRIGLDLLVDENGDFLFLNLYRQDSKRPAVPDGEGFSTAATRERICDENSRAGKENCLADLGLLTGGGVVVERFFNRPGVTLLADGDFSRVSGGNLLLRYASDAEMNEPAKDVMAEYRLRLERTPSGWVLLGATATPEEAPTAVGSLKLSSKFAGMYASGVDSIRISASKHAIW